MGRPSEGWIIFATRNLYMLLTGSSRYLDLLLYMEIELLFTGKISCSKCVKKFSAP